MRSRPRSRAGSTPPARSAGRACSSRPAARASRSSGRMGVALAEEAAARGADVTLVLAAAAVEPPPALPTVRVESADELRAATHAAAERADVVVMAAAVADYRPAEPLAGKRAKDGRPWTLALEPTADVLAELGARRRPGQVLVGFA